MHFTETMEDIVRAFEIAGVLILAVGSVWAIVSTLPVLRRGDVPAAYQRARQQMGHAILLGLEVLIIADIVRTITVEPTLESAGILAVIVLVRTFLSFSLEIELEGIVPWQRWRRKVNEEA